MEDYGFEADIEIFRPLFSKERFPKLTYLGIVNSEEQDKIVEMFLESDILPQLETMDVSAGTLKDEGAQLLLDNMDKIAHLKFINMRYNYLSKDMKKRGFKFFGATICYAHLQAAGFINDHLADCICR